MTLSWSDGLVLGLVQGLTEFLPISSSGHLVLAEELLGYRSPGLYFEIGLHVATLLSVFIAYGGRIRQLIHGLLGRQGEAWRYAGLLLLASVPAAVVGISIGAAAAEVLTVGVAVEAHPASQQQDQSTQ